MRLRVGSCALVAVFTAGVASADSDGPVRLSLPSETDRAAWLRSGFRLGLGISYGMLHGVSGLPDSGMKGVVIRPGLRLDRQWSIYLSLQYAMLDLDGVRYASTIEPTWHVTPHLAVSFGMGYAGFSGLSHTFAGPPEPDVNELGQSYTYPETRPTLAGCTGVGVTGTGSVELGYVLGPRSRTHVSLQALTQWIGCEEETGTLDPYTGVELVRRQWWGHNGASLIWGIEWR